MNLDPDRIVVLYAELGQVAAERVLSAAMEDLAVHLVAIQMAVLDRQEQVILRGLDELGRLARQVGMRVLSQVARDLADCVTREDAVAQAAVLARLVRIGDRSLTAVWDLQDMRG
ncbi:hypothetical protein [Paenirhodobacter sp. CAU 1674]|uniref:hypothetical protein n=1 Tax=Paenirhodobacter sp. CAU 1674 TaxID=3032596 RepID=UPI0023DA45EB|nr:hypothetical protein [Paenirhodobacter sp. CAU 1674]MDF2141424.1 hypothetical protein [Paenirhodobacter sp. CAU 1674]